MGRPLPVGGIRFGPTRSAQRAKSAGCEWLHVDFTDELRTFYIDACGFDRPQGAGLMNLRALRPA